MQLEHRFTVPAPIDAAWETLNDVQRVGACFPGAAVTSVEGEEFKGTCKVKLGPISMQYTGSGKFLERDAERYRAVIEARGKDRRGNGTASVTVTTVLTPEGDDRTAVAVDTDLNITGKPAQFGRGVIQDVSNKLLGQFTDCLESQFGGDQATGAAAGAGTGVTAAAGTATDAPTAVDESGSAVGAGPATTAAAEPPQPPTETAPGTAEVPGATTASAGTAAGAAPSSSKPSGSASALDLGATVLPVLAKRYAPHAVGVLAVLVVLWRILRR